MTRHWGVTPSGCNGVDPAYVQERRRHQCVADGMERTFHGNSTVDDDMAMAVRTRGQHGP